jgi:hypothetical protein
LRWVGGSGYAGVAHDITTGEGYYPGSGTNGRYYGHCTDGRQVGSQPGTSNTHYHRALACPCYASDDTSVRNSKHMQMASAAAAEAAAKRKALADSTPAPLNINKQQRRATGEL